MRRLVSGLPASGASLLEAAAGAARACSSNAFTAAAAAATSRPVPTVEETVTVTFIDPNRSDPWRRQTVQAPVGSTVVDLAKAHGVDIHAACGQKLQCATCHVILTKSHFDKLPPRGLREEDLLDSTITLTSTSRLGCQVRLTPELDGIELTLPDARQKGSTRMSLEQPRPRVERHWTETPAVMPSVRRGGVISGVTAVAPDHQAASLTETSRLQRELEDERSLTARLESELRQLRQRAAGGPASGRSGAATEVNSDSEDPTQGGSGEDSSLAKVKAELLHTKVDTASLQRRVSFEDVVGLEEPKTALLEAIVWPAVASPELFAGVRGGPKGLLLYGPPGCGKTMLARAAAAELGGRASFFHIRPGDIMSKFYGESQRRAQALEELTREAAPAVVFLDEVDSLLGSRDGAGVAEHHRATTNALLAWMDGFGTGAEQVFFLGATNRPEAIDEAALRRFGDAVEVGYPCERARLSLLQHLVQVRAAGQGHLAALSDADLEDVARRTEGRSLADVDRLVRRAFMQVLRDMPGGVRPGLHPSDVPPVALHHFEAALQGAEGTNALLKMLRKRAESRGRL